MNTSNNNQQKEDNTDSKLSSAPEVHEELSKVASNPKKSLLIIGAAVILFVFIIFKVLLGGEEKAPINKQAVLPKSITKPTNAGEQNIPQIPRLPEPLKLVEPKIAPPPPPPPAPEVSDAPQQKLPIAPITEVILPNQGQDNTINKKRKKYDDDEEARKENKRKSSIVLINGSDKATPKDPTEIAEVQVYAKKKNELEYILGRGKIISAVLETAVNTDFGGEIRAVISEDVFSQSGRIILIPKGSRIFGAYTTDTGGPGGRVAVQWTHIDLANGYSIDLEGISIDNLGRPGAPGYVDHKYKEKLANVVMMSTFNVAVGELIDKVITPTVTAQQSLQSKETVSTIRTSSLAISTENRVNDEEKIQRICNSVKDAIKDKTSTAYNQINQGCLQFNTNAGGATPQQRLGSLMNLVGTVADSLMQTSIQNDTLTKSQTAAKQAFKDITDTVKGMVEQNNLKTTITINPGTSIRIYVKRDYKFPSRIASQSFKILK